MTSILKASEEPPFEINRSIWSIGLGGYQNNLKSGDGNHVLGVSSVVQLGRGYIGDTWFATGAVEFISGPFQSPEQQNLVVDFSGTGFSTWIGFSAENQNLRTEAGNYGFLLGLNYSDIIGRSVGDRVTNEGGTTTSNWVMRVNNFTIFPSIFFTWLKPPREKGNSPELLLTRIEGYLLKIGIAAPLQIRYKVKYDENERKIVRKGELEGYTVMITFSTLFGA